MTICTVIEAIKSAHTEHEIRCISENALKTYAFDGQAVEEIKQAVVTASYAMAHTKAIERGTDDVPMAAGDMSIELEAVCIYEPRGLFGLEGYQRGETYRCQFVVKRGNPPYYRMFPQPGSIYYECVDRRSAARFFRIEEKA